uniref:nSTAND1 domain-containing NTPase n=1 Tax=Mastigocoleus sp. MO_188.B34 TaxID=3036635 RepID=UPI00260A54EC
MQVLVNFKFGDGDFANGFSETVIKANIASGQHSKDIKIQLPSAPLIPSLYRNWQNRYIELFEARGIKILPSKSLATNFYPENENDVIRGFTKIPTNLSFEQSKQECDSYALDLCTEVNQWLEKIRSQLERQLLLEANSQVLLEIHTQNITSQQTKDILHRLPWREWDYFHKGSGLEVEVVLCLSEFESNSPEVKDDGKFRRVKITSIFGDSKNINVESDKELITKLEGRGAELILLEQPQRQEFSKLWDEPCDILFYSGHSETFEDGTVGSLQINSQENLNLQEIRNTLGEAVKKGLKLAIFNSCDGLGLGKQLADLHLPYIIVWREPVPDKIAIGFLEYFLNSYTEGKSLFTSVRDARLKFIELTPESEKQIPGLNWLPIICKNTSDSPPTWEDLGGLRGKLPNCPYKGLSAFTEEDKNFFFGRDNAIADLVQAVDTQPLVGVIGASGSGKSSLVFAGLVPHLRTTSKVEIVSFRPGKNPFDSLTVALSSHIRSTVIATQGSNPNLLEISNECASPTQINLLHDEKALHRLIENIVASGQISPQSSKNIPQLCRDVPWNVSIRDYGVTDNSVVGTSNGQTSYQHQRFVLIADQFEELYTLTSEKQRQTFLDALLYAVRFTPGFTLVFTLRADFMGKTFVDYKPMGETLRKYPPILVTQMNRVELTAAIEQPAAKMKVEFEKGLTSKLIDDLGEQPGRLPLLEFTLSQLWDRHDKWYLTHQAYEEIGGLEKALAKYADSILNSLSDEDKEKAEQIFIQLVSPGEGTEDTKRKATRGEVGEDNWDWVEFFANKRLLVTGWDQSTQEKTVEIIHEALIREWGMLCEWIKSNRQFRVWQERLQFTVVKWEDKKRSPEYLLSGGNLGEAEGWYFDQKYQEYLSDSQSEFIRESLDAKDREEAEQERQRQEKVRLQKRAISWLSGGLLAVSAATGFAGWNWVNAEITSTRERLNSSILTSENYLDLEDYSDALFEAIKTQQFLDDSWWKSQVPNDIKKKIQIVINQPIHSFIEAKHTIKGHKEAVTRVVLSPDGKTIASASLDETVKLWDAQNRQLIHTLEGHKNEVWSVVFSPDGKTIVSASTDGILKLWDAQNRQLIHTWEGHKNSVMSVVFSPDGKTIASASTDRTVKLWDAQNRQLIHTLKGHENSVWSVVFSPDGKTIASASLDGTVKLWDAQNRNLIHTLEGHKNEVWSVVFSPDGKTIASASFGGILKLWDVQNRQLIHTWEGHKNSVWSVVFSPDGKTIASASLDGTVKLWDAQNRKLIYTLEGHKNEVWSVVFSPDGKTIASASFDETVKLWDKQNRKLINTLEGHKSSVSSVVFSPDGKTIASGSTDRTVKLWDAQNRKLIYTLEGHKNSVSSVVFSPDGKTIASASFDGTVKLWDAQNRQLIYTLKGHKNSVWSVVFSPDGKTIASGSTGGILKLWDAQNRQLIHTWEGHKNSLRSVVFSPDGKTIASASFDGTVKLWDAQNRQLIYTLKGHKN